MKNLLLVSGLLLVLFSACTNEVDVIDLPQEGRETLTLKAVMPGSDTRLAMTQDELDVRLTWEATDVLHLCFIDGSIKKQVSVPVETISEDGKLATFNFIVPEGITSDEFQVSGVVGGELSPAPGEEDLVIFPATPWSGGSLSEIQSKGLYVATFTSSVDISNPVVNVSLEHHGSLFSIRLTNNGNFAHEGIQKVQLKGVDGDGNPATIGAYTGGGTYNLGSNSGAGGYENMVEAGSVLSFQLDNPIDLGVGETAEFWGWFIPTHEVWPELILEVFDDSDNLLATSGDSKPERTESTAIGKAFYFDAVWDETFLAFNETAQGNLIVNGSFEDDFHPMRKPGTAIYGGNIAYAEPMRIASYFNPKTEQYWPKHVDGIPNADLPTFDTENNIWYFGNRHQYSHLRLYIDELKETPFGNKTLTFLNVRADNAAQVQGATTPFHYTAVQRVNLDNSKVYKLNFSYLRADVVRGPSGAPANNHVTRFIAGIVSFTDTSTPLDASFSVDVPIPLAGDETWKGYEVEFDLPALIAANPGFDFSTSAIIFGIQTETGEYLMMPGQISIDNVRLKEQ